MNERFFSLSAEKQQAIINAGYRVFSHNAYKNSPMSEIAEKGYRNQRRDSTERSQVFQFESGSDADTAEP